MTPEEIRYHMAVDAVLRRARARQEALNGAPPGPVVGRSRHAEQPDAEDLDDRSWVR